MSDGGPQFLSPQELADYLNISVRSVYAWNHAQTGPRPIKVGKHVRYRLSDVETWLDSNTGPGAA